MIWQRVRWRCWRRRCLAVTYRRLRRSVISSHCAEPKERWGRIAALLAAAMLEIPVTLLLTLSSPLLRAELRDLAAESLALLQAALPREAAAFPALFSLPVYGALIGMFELNNLGAPGTCISIVLSLSAMHPAQIRWCSHCRHSSRRRCTTVLLACSRPTTWVHFCWALRWLRPFSGCSPVGLALCHAEPSC